MSERPAERLYHLLPAVYRQRDFHEGEPLRALLGVMEAELEAIEEDVGGLYENWFIETCEEWVVPYLAELLGVRGLEDESAAVVSQRARVANALGYRRRKGTLAALEGVVRDATGWPARAVELFELLAATQHLEHPRPGRGAIFDLKAVRDPRPLGGPFENAAHNADLRSIAAGEGRYNLGNLGLFLYRLESFGLAGCRAFKIAGGCYTFHPVGYDVPLFTRPRPEGEFTRVAEHELPGPIRRGAFERDLEEYRARHAAIAPEHRPSDSAYYGPSRSLRIVHDGKPVPPSDVVVADLGDWPRPAPGRVAVDVTRGRIAFAEGEEPAAVEVSYHYGFSAPLGSGPYDRRAGLSDPGRFEWQARVTRDGSLRTLQQALDAWKGSGEDGQPPPRGLIRIADSATYGGALQLELPPGGALAIEAEDGVRPCLRLFGRLDVAGPDAGRAELTLDGLLIKGGIQLKGGIDLRVSHSTVLATDAIRADDRSDVELTIDHSIVGALRLPAEARQVTVCDSIVGLPGVVGKGYPAVAAAGGESAGPPLALERTTVFGPAFVRRLTLASEVIFTAPVRAERRQTGCVRFSYLPEGSETPRRFRCPKTDKPRFTAVHPVHSVHPVHPAFAQLADDCPQEIRTGAADGSEMGAFRNLQQAQRETNLRAVLDEYVSVGLEVGVVFVT